MPSPVCHMGGSFKTAEIKIVKFSPYGSPIYLYFYRVSFVQKFQQVLLSGGDQQWRGGKTSHFLDLHDSISKTVRDTSKVTVSDQEEVA